MKKTLSVFFATLFLLMSFSMLFTSSAAEIETPHPYTSASVNRAYSFTYSEDANILAVKFSSQTMLENGDLFVLKNASNKVFATFYHDALAGKTIYVSGNSFSVTIESANSGTKVNKSKAYGFAIESVTAYTDSFTPLSTFTISQKTISANTNTTNVIGTVSMNANATSNLVYYTSSNEAVCRAIIDKDGKCWVVPVNKGVSTITATAALGTASDTSSVEIRGLSIVEAVLKFLNDGATFLIGLLRLFTGLF